MDRQGVPELDRPGAAEVERQGTYVCLFIGSLSSLFKGPRKPRWIAC